MYFLGFDARKKESLAQKSKNGVSTESTTSFTINTEFFYEMTNKIADMEEKKTQKGPMR